MVGNAYAHSFDNPHVAPYWPTWPCLVADTQLYKRLCSSVHRSVGPSVRHGDRVGMCENAHFRPCPPVQLVLAVCPALFFSLLLYLNLNPLIDVLPLTLFGSSFHPFAARIGKALQRISSCAFSTTSTDSFLNLTPSPYFTVVVVLVGLASSGTV